MIELERVLLDMGVDPGDLKEAAEAVTKIVDWVWVKNG